MGGVPQKAWTIDSRSQASSAASPSRAGATNSGQGQPAARRGASEGAGATSKSVNEEVLPIEVICPAASAAVTNEGWPERNVSV